jgi:hypothetical protein
MSGTKFSRRSWGTCKLGALSSIHWCGPVCLFVISYYASKFLFNSSWCWETLLFSAYELVVFMGQCFCSVSLCVTVSILPYLMWVYGFFRTTWRGLIGFFKFTCYGEIFFFVHKCLDLSAIYWALLKVVHCFCLRYFACQYLYQRFLSLISIYFPKFPWCSSLFLSRSKKNKALERSEHKWKYITSNWVEN